jgi:hypothetical protein
MPRWIELSFYGVLCGLWWAIPWISGPVGLLHSERPLGRFTGYLMWIACGLYATWVLIVRDLGRGKSSAPPNTGGRKSK